MKRQVLVFPVVVALVAMDSYACQCMWAGTFRKMAAGSGLVVHGRIVEYGKKLSHGDGLYESMKVEVIQVVKGSIKAKTVRILGDRGADCRPYITARSFGINEEYLFALYESNKSTQPISACGEYWIHVESDVAEGIAKRWNFSHYEDEPYSIPLTELIEQIATDSLGTTN